MGVIKVNDGLNSFQVFHPISSTFKQYECDVLSHSYEHTASENTEESIINITQYSFMQNNHSPSDTWGTPPSLHALPEENFTVINVHVHRC